MKTQIVQRTHLTLRFWCVKRGDHIAYFTRDWQFVADAAHDIANGKDVPGLMWVPDGTPPAPQVIEARRMRDLSNQLMNVSTIKAGI